MLQLSTEHTPHNCSSLSPVKEEKVFLETVPGSREPYYLRPEQNQRSDLVQDWDVLFLPQDPQPTQGPGEYEMGIYYPLSSIPIPMGGSWPPPPHLLCHQLSTECYRLSSQTWDVNGLFPANTRV